MTYIPQQPLPNRLIDIDWNTTPSLFSATYRASHHDRSLRFSVADIIRRSDRRRSNHQLQQTSAFETSFVCRRLGRPTSGPYNNEATEVATHLPHAEGGQS